MLYAPIYMSWGVASSYLGLGVLRDLYKANQARVSVLLFGLGFLLYCIIYVHTKTILAAMYLALGGALVLHVWAWATGHIQDKWPMMLGGELEVLC